MNRLLALVLAGLLSSCVLSRGTVNEPLPVAEVEGLQVGSATATDVLAALGAPTDVVQLGLKSAWSYQFSSAKSASLFLFLVNFTNDDVRSDRVWVFFDEEGVVTNLGSTFEAKDTVYAMPWSRIHE